MAILYKNESFKIEQINIYPSKLINLKNYH